MSQSANADSAQIVAGLFRQARDVPFKIAPEKSSELAREVFGGDDWEVRASQTEANLYAIAPDKAIYVAHAAIASLWCVSHVAYAVVDIASRLNRLPGASSFEAVDLGPMFAGRGGLDEYLSHARKLIHRDQFWPDDLDRPDESADFNAFEGRVNNVCLGALSFLMLHEIGHVYLGHVSLVPSHLRIVQEFEADRFATHWILENVPSGEQREFRVLMIVTALAWMFISEEERGQGPNHPATILRFREAVSNFDLGEESPALENATYLFKSLFDRRTSMPTGLSAMQAFDWICSRMEELFPRR